MSPRAASRLERLGFTEVYDYVAGEADWLAFWLPWEGRATLAGQVLRKDVPTCRITEPARVARERLAATDLDRLVAVDDEGVVHGVVRDLGDVPGEVTVEEVMVVGPSTVRPSEPLAPLLDRMRHRDVGAVVVTSSDGRLLGMLEREAASRALE